jgi:site-specific DNA-methyltransferase (adenine-specific)
MSNSQMFKFELIWNKLKGSNFQNAKYHPLKSHENILVFGDAPITYNPQFWFSKPIQSEEKHERGSGIIEGIQGGTCAKYKIAKGSHDGRRYPLSIIECNRDQDRIHPTQKPVNLFKYLIKTFSNKGDIVLDNCLGSGTTAIACIETERNWIGIEKEQSYCEMAENRIKTHKIGRRIEW